MNTRRLSTRVVAAALAATALIATGCAGDGNGPQFGAPASGNAPHISIMAPQRDAVVQEGAHAVVIEVTNVNVVDGRGVPLKDREAGFIYYLDQAQIPVAPGKPATTAKGTYHASPEVSYQFPNIGQGKHTVVVQLVHLDLTPFEPPVLARRSMTVKGTFKFPKKSDDEKASD